MGKAIKIQDIANALNLSRNTVSKALNNKPVPLATRKRIIAKAIEMNYKSMDFNPNIVSIEKKKIALISTRPLTTVDFFKPIITEIEQSLIKRKWDLIRYIYIHNKEEKYKLKSLFRDLHIDGVICAEVPEKEAFFEIIESKIPAVLLDIPYLRKGVDGNYDVVFNDEVQSIEDIIRKLIKETGAQNFTFIGDPYHCRSFHTRFETMVQTLFEAKNYHDASNDILDKDQSSAYEVSHIASFLQGLKQLPDVIIGANDYLACQALEALKLLRIKVPQQVQIMGFDNAPQSQTCFPKLTTIGCSQSFIGKEAVTTLASRIDDPSIPSRKIYIKTNIIIRDSTRIKD